jgi:Anti-sigma-K factor rskA
VTRFDELVGDVGDPAERERLRRVHDLLLAVEPLPAAVPPLRATPGAERGWSRRMVLALAAALALVAFGSGYVVGESRDAAETERVIEMQGEAGEAHIELLAEDGAGNWPMNVVVRGLEPSRDRTDFYELWLTRDGALADSCGRFLLREGVTTVTLTVPYALRRYDGWVVTRAGSNRVLLTT